MGSVPPFDRDLPDFDMLVLCAKELQPERVGFQRKLVRVAISDGFLSTDELSRAILGSRQVAGALAGGRRVLVTCAAGLNRSGLVTGLALGLVTQMSAAQIVELVRERRAPAALGNPHFVELLHRFVGQRRPDKR